MNRKNFLSEYGALIALVLLFAINVARRGGNFLQVENLRNLVSQNSAVGIIAIGMTLVIIAGGIDLSVGSLTAMCGAAAILLVNKLASGGMNANLVILLAALGVLAAVRPSVFRSLATPPAAARIDSATPEINEVDLSSGASEFSEEPAG